MLKRTGPDTEEQALRRLRALADPTRLRILELLRKPGCCSATGVDDRSGGMCVCDLQARLELSQPTITHHLRVLREAGLVDCRKIGLWLYCRRDEKAIAELGRAVAAL